MPSTASPARLTRGYTIALVSAILLSTTSIFIRYLTREHALPALVLAFWRDLFVSLSLLLGLGVLRPVLLRLPRSQIGYLVIYGFVLAVFNSLWTLSVAINGAAVATVMAYCSAAFTVLLGWWLLKESLHWVKMAAAVLCLAGCALVAGIVDPAGWELNWYGSLIGILAGLLWAAYSLMGRSASQRGLNPWTTLFHTFTFAAGFLFILNLLPGGFIPGAAGKPGNLLWLGDSWLAWVVLFLLAAGPTVAGFGLYNVALSRLPSSVVNLIATSEPVFTALIAFLLLGERLAWIQILGSLLILGGVILLRFYEGWLESRDKKNGKLVTEG